MLGFSWLSRFGQGKVRFLWMDLDLVVQWSCDDTGFPSAGKNRESLERSKQQIPYDLDQFSYTEE